MKNGQWLYSLCGAECGPAVQAVGHVVTDSKKEDD